MTTLRPPRPGMTFRVGVVGHRWDKLVPAADRTVPATQVLEERLVRTSRRILEQIAERVGAVAADPAAGYREGAPARLAVVSGLAEGGDRIVAKAGLGLGYQLWAVLPFAAGDYREDFGGRWEAPWWSRPGAAEEFDHLLGQASDSITMDGDIADRASAYEPLGRAVVAHTDLLIALWDGRPAAGPGGTADLIREARWQEIPVVRIDPAHPEHPWLEGRDPEDRTGGLDGLDLRLRQLVAPPELAGLAEASDWNGRAAFQREPVFRGLLVGHSFRVLSEFFARRRTVVGAALWPSALAWLRVVGSALRPSLPADYGEAGRAEWVTRMGTLAETGEGPRVIERLSRLHGWLDHLARYYADRYRSSFTAMFSLAWIAAVAAAVGMAASALHWPHAERWPWLEAGVMAVLFGLLLWGRWGGRFHEKWIAYRMAAEQIRHLAFLWPLGAVAPAGRLPAEPSTDDPRTQWTGWLYRAWLRELGFGARRMDPAHLAWCRAMLQRVELPHQREYHTAAAERCERIHRVLGIRTFLLFAMAGVVAGLHLVDHAVLGFLGLEGAEDALKVALPILSIFFTARASALHGWSGQADFPAAALRSTQIHVRLEELLRELDGLQVDASRTLGVVALDAARAMEGDLGAWRATSLSRPLQQV